MKRIVFTLLLLSLVAVGCATSRSNPGASAVIEPKSGSSVTGTVSFTDQANGVLVKVDITGLAPGLHGFHLHEKGDCSAPDATSAGPHFNPASAPHGAPDAAPHHAGDLGNITADAAGEVHVEIAVTGLTITAGSSSVVGRSVVVHASPDDLTSQPAGNAGARIGCGVVTLAPKM